jgi:cytochrome c
MRLPAVTICSAALLLSAPGAHASPELARQKLCMGCHTVDKKQVGPAFKDIAARYAGQKDAVPRMAEKIVKGGSGAWGPVPMPANPKVTPDEARQLSAWILGLR